MANTWEASNIIEEMKGYNMLHDWDVMVAYHLDFLNKQLDDIAKKPENKPILQKVPAVKWNEPKIGRNHAMDYTVNITLGSPTMHFLDTTTGGQAQITFPVSGEVIAETKLEEGESPEPGDKLTVALPDNLTLTLTTDLAKVVSTLVDGKETEEKSSANSITALDVAKESKTYLALDFTHVSARLSKEWIDKHPEHSNVIQHATSNLENYFTEHGTVYRLVGLGATKDEKTVLHPTRVCFTVSPADGNNKAKGAALLMWVNCNNRNGGEPDTVAKPLRFTGKTDAGQTCPVPSTHEASVTFSHNLIWEKIISAAFRDAGFSDPTDLTGLGGAGDNNEGFRFSVSLPDKEICIEKHTEATYPRPNIRNDPDQTTTKSFQFNLKTNGHNPGPAIISLKSNSSSCYWKYTQEHVEFSRHADYVEPIHKYGKASLDFTIDKISALWEMLYDDENERIKLELQFSLNFPECFKVSTPKAEEGDIWDKALGWTTTMPRYFSRLQVQIPPLDIKSGLNYFLVTNLLFANNEVFQADVNDDTTRVWMPRDVFIAGNCHHDAGENRYMTFRTVHTAAITPKIKQLRAEMLNNKSSFGVEITRAIANDTDEEPLVEAVLKKYKFEDVSVEELSTITLIPNPDQGIPNPSPAPPIRTMFFDSSSAASLKDFGAMYQITSPFDLMDKFVIISPQSGSVIVDTAAEVKPTVVMSDDKLHPVANWTSTINDVQYTFKDVLFTSSVDQSTYKFVSSFAGQVAIGNAPFVNFAGAKAQAPADPNDPADRWPQSPWLRFTAFANGTGFVASVIGIAGVMFGIQSWKWHREDKKRRDEASEAAVKRRKEKEESAKATKAEMANLREGLKVIAKDKATKKGSEVRMKEIETHVRKELRKDYEGQMESGDLKNLDPKDPWGATDPLDVRKLTELKEHLENGLDKSVRDAINADRGPVVDGLLLHWEKTGLITDVERKEIKEGILKDVADRMITHLKTDPAGGGKSYLLETGRAMLAEQISTIAKDEKESASKSETAAKELKERLEAKAAKDAETLKTKEDLLQHEEDVEKKKEIEQEISDLNADIKKDAHDKAEAAKRQGEEASARETAKNREEEGKGEHDKAKENADKEFGKFE